MATYVPNPLPVTDNGGSLTVDDGSGSLTVDATSLPLPTGASTEATLALVKAKTDNIPPLGQALAAASTPVILPAATITTLTPPAAITGFATETTLAAESAKLPATLGQKAMAASMAVVVASDQSAVPVSGPLTDTQLRATPVPVSGTVMATGGLTDTQLRATPVPVSGTVTASGPVTDTQLRAAAVPVSAASLPLPFGAATETSLAAAATSLSVMDDWDETDRAKVNPIAGQAGVQGAAGATTALTQRVTVATDQPPLSNRSISSQQLGALDAAATLNVEGCGCAVVTAWNGPAGLVGTIVIEGYIGGSWRGVPATDISTGTTLAADAALPRDLLNYIVYCAGLTQLRIRVNAYTSGNCTVWMTATVGSTSMEAYPTVVSSTVIPPSKAASGSYTATGGLVFDCSGCASVACSVLGTWTATIYFLGTIDGSAYFFVPGVKINTGLYERVTTTQVQMGGIFTVAGLKYFYANIVSYTSGTVNIGIQGTASAGISYIGGPVDLSPSSTAVVTSVAAPAGTPTSAATLLTYNAARKSFTVYNDSTAVLYLKYGTSPSTTSFTVKLQPSAYFEPPAPFFNGDITGVWATQNGSARITETS